MNKKLLIYCLLLNCVQVIAQNISEEENKMIFQKDTIITEHSVFDYFRQERDSFIHAVGVIIMPIDSLSFFGENEFTFKVSNPERGYLEVYHRGYLIYRYMLINYDINGTGFCYYPFSGNIALQGRFKEGKLHGLVSVQKEDGEILQIMKFKGGKYVKHVYHCLRFSRKSLKAISRNRSYNPLRGDEIIVR